MRRGATSRMRSAMTREPVKYIGDCGHAASTLRCSSTEQARYITMGLELLSEHLKISENMLCGVGARQNNDGHAGLHISKDLPAEVQEMREVADCTDKSRGPIHCQNAACFVCKEGVIEFPLDEQRLV